MASGMIPGTGRPQLSKEDALKRLAAFDVSAYPVKILGIRGYFKKTMGDPSCNDVGIYDDALFITSDTAFWSFVANVDPSRIFPHVATLKIGGPYLYRIGLHGLHHLSLPKDQWILTKLLTTKQNVVIPGRILPYWALRQSGNVTVIRDGKECTDSPENRFYIDIHKGGYNTTSSEGCQTIYPDQWEGFYKSVTDEILKYNQTIIPYCLIEN